MALKRNLGLRLARMLGWRRVLFLDDDVSHFARPDDGSPPPGATSRSPGDGSGSLRAETLAAIKFAVGALDEVAVAAWRTPSFRDHSVVRHAHWRVGGDRDVFLSSNGMAVAVDERTAFFPPVYNEDWLFLYPALAEGRVAYAGDGTQEAYDPFADPARASREEFGDLLAETLMDHLHTGVPSGGITLAHWRAAIGERERLLDWIQHRLDLPALPDERRLAVAASLDAARAQLLMISAGQLHEFVRAWQEDLAAWRRLMAEPVTIPADLPDSQRIEQALDRLGLGDQLIWASWRA